MSDIIDVQTNDQKAEDLKAIGWVSYVLHLIVALGAVIPGAQPGAALLIVALVIDLVKKGDGLYAIVSKFKPALWSHDEAMQHVYAQNTHAFASKKYNTLKAGATLTIDFGSAHAEKVESTPEPQYQHVYRGPVQAAPSTRAASKEFTEEDLLAAVQRHTHNPQMPIGRKQTAHALHKQLVIIHQQDATDFARDITHRHGLATGAANGSASSKSSGRGHMPHQTGQG